MATNDMKQLRKLYEPYFKIGVACEHVSERWTNNEIGNPKKEQLIASQFASLTMANELKPAYNMGYASPEAKEDFLPFVLNQGAKTILDFAKANHVMVRGHVMVWHSQCADEAFCKGYKKVTIPTDPELLKENPRLKYFEKLDPVCFVDRQTMLKRLESYIYTLLYCMYDMGYADIIYAWDVVNEAIELDDKTPTGLRNSYWYKVIGDDFIYWAFRFAKQALSKLAPEFAPKYHVDPSDPAALKTITPSLFYNDYNEFMPEKRDAIIAILSRETKEHGSVFSEHLIDGIGMQGHISDNTNLDEYMEALMIYGKLADEIHITELDVKCTCTNANAEYYQAVFYKDLFTRLIEAKKNGINITNVTLWGLTDDNSWIRGANPLLFHGDLSPKKSFDGLVYAAIGGDLGEPLQIKIDLSDRLYDFSDVKEDKAAYLEELGFRMKGFGGIELTDKEHHSGTTCLACEKRFGDWCGMSLDISDFIGQTVEISAWVKSPAPTVQLMADVTGTNSNPVISSIDAANDWTLLTGTYKVPHDVHSMVINFSTKENNPQVNSPIYVDDMSIHLIGQEESFEEAAHTAFIRGIGHLPFLQVTDKEAVTPGTHSLLVTRHEKEATVKFSISSYIGCKVKISAYVKTTDSIIRLGLDGESPLVFAETEANRSGFTKIEATADIPSDLRSAFFFLETDGNADYYVDDVFVTLA